jgi:hypothetical protein
MSDEIIDVHAHWSDLAVLVVALEEGQAAAEHRLARGDEDETADFGRVRRSGTTFPITLTGPVVWDSVPA